MSAEPTKIQSIRDAIEHLHPIGVEFYSLSAAIDESEPIVSDDSDATLNDGSGRKGTVDIEVQTATRIAEFGVDYRCKLVVPFPDAEIIVDGAILYQADTQIEIEKNVCREFGDEVAIMSLFPYLRQTVGDLAARIGHTATLSLLERGQITF